MVRVALGERRQSLIICTPFSVPKGELMSIKSLFNIGGLSLAITCEKDKYSQGDAVYGKVLLQGGKYQQQLRLVKIQLEEFWQENRHISAGTKVPVSNNRISCEILGPLSQSIILARQTSTAPFSEIMFDFSIQLPLNCRISKPSSGWRLTADADIVKARDAKTNFILNVVPSQEITLFIQTLVEKLQFKPVPTWDPYEPNSDWYWNARVTHTTLHPPTSLQSKLSSIEFDMRNTGRGLNIEAVFDAIESGPSRQKFNIPSEQIWTTNRQSNSEKILKVFESILQNVVSKRG